MCCSLFLLEALSQLSSLSERCVLEVGYTMQLTCSTETAEKIQMAFTTVHRVTMETAVPNIYLTFFFCSVKAEQGGHEPFYTTCSETWGSPYQSQTPIISGSHPIKDSPDMVCVN